MGQLINLEDCKNDTAIKKKIRQVLTDDLQQYISQKYDDVSRIGVNQIAAAVAQVKDKDGFLVDANVVIKVEVKTWNTVKRIDGKITEAFDREEEENNYKIESK